MRFRHVKMRFLVELKLLCHALCNSARNRLKTVGHSLLVEEGLVPYCDIVDKSGFCGEDCEEILYSFKGKCGCHT